MTGAAFRTNSDFKPSPGISVPVSNEFGSKFSGLFSVSRRLRHSTAAAAEPPAVGVFTDRNAQVVILFAGAFGRINRRFEAKVAEELISDVGAVFRRANYVSFLLRLLPIGVLAALFESVRFHVE